MQCYEVIRDVEAAGDVGRGPLGHPLPSGHVSRLPGARKSIFSDKISKNRQVSPIFDTAKGKEGQGRLKSHYENFRDRSFSILPNLLLSDCRAFRAWLGMRKRVVGTSNRRSHFARCSDTRAIVARFHACMTQLRVRKGNDGQNLTTKIPEIENP